MRLATKLAALAAKWATQSPQGRMETWVEYWAQQLMESDKALVVILAPRYNRQVQSSPEQ